MNEWSAAQQARAHVHIDPRQRENERRTWRVIWLTLTVMIIEIAAGMAFNSMALLADGWHMASHTGALGVTAFTYWFARKHAHDPRFSFGTGKVGALGGFASAVALVVVALFMAIESVARLISPLDIALNQAIFVAVLGLVVNLVSALLLGHGHSHGHDGENAHDHGHDHNLRAAYMHVLADALTSVLAIVALLAAKFAGWVFLDPVIGVVGAVIISKWGYGLIRDTSAILLDQSPSDDVLRDVKEKVEACGDCRVEDLHIWPLSEGRNAAIVSVRTSAACNVDDIKKRLEATLNLAHATVEVRGE